MTTRFEGTKDFVHALSVFSRETTSLGYAWTRSESEAMGFTFPASSERRHVLDAVASVRLAEEWRAGAAWRYRDAATGAVLGRSEGLPREPPLQ